MRTYIYPEFYVETSSVQSTEHFGKITALHVVEIKQIAQISSLFFGRKILFCKKYQLIYGKEYGIMKKITVSQRRAKKYVPVSTGENGVNGQMKRAGILLMCLAMLAALTSCKRAEQNDTPEPDAMLSGSVLSETQEDVLNEFDRALLEYIWLNGYYDADFIISPAAFRASLCLAAAGAEGNTRTELLRAAGFADMDTMEQWYQSFRDAAENSGCLAAASVWNDSEQIGEFSDVYLTNIRQQYHADASVSMADTLTCEIEEWISASTNGAVTSVEKDVAGASSVLVSTVYLHVSDSDGELLYAEDGGIKILAIPLEGDLTLVCFSGNRTDMFAGIAALHPESVHAALPDMELASTFDATDLLNFLLARGVGEALNGQTANFYNMCQNGEWFLQEIIQTAKISLDGVDDFRTDNTDSDDENREWIAAHPFSFAVFYGLGTAEQEMLLYGQAAADAEPE